MFTFFTNTLVTDKEKSLVRQHEGDYNDHVINKELLAHMSTSTIYSIESSTILTYITVARIWN